MAKDRRRWLSWEGVSNAKDLGGLALASGGFTQWGRLFRAAQLDDLTPTGSAELREAGVRTVIDLRNDFERPALSVATVETYWLPIEDHTDATFMAEWGASLSSPAYYRAALERWPEKLAAVFRAMAEAPPGGILFHCVSGRDRTGLVSALLLRLAGVPVEAVVDDYESSATNLSARSTSEARAQLRTLLDGFDVHDYLATAGVSAGQLAAVRHRLIA